ncbi:type II toxin-antitoxin system VapC family toxin [Agromyces albus]|uniref:Ribonuclease VapC n=1 Tax=Agromyces albus TaxID=205332 RepID=A0A4Q2KWW0_9MICO|nr:type II toxin-antitoxin system VapC family toxin [Agromyces albus]RXZ68322.1 PIN domain-containing protein [Agromyces albus]
MRAHRPLVVVDASAIVTLLIDPGEPGEVIASRLRDAAVLAPALLPFEVANVLRRRMNARLLSGAEAALAHADLLDLPIDLWPWEALATRAWELGSNLSSYDASYVALAEETDATLLTRDRRIAAAPGIRCRVDVV